MVPPMWQDPRVQTAYTITISIQLPNNIANAEGLQ